MFLVRNREILKQGLPAAFLLRNREIKNKTKKQSQPPLCVSFKKQD